MHEEETEREAVPLRFRLGGNRLLKATTHSLFIDSIRG